MRQVSFHLLILLAVIFAIVTLRFQLGELDFLDHFPDVYRKKGAPRVALEVRKLLFLAGSDQNRTLPGE
jgi:hypothetical protein